MNYTANGISQSTAEWSRLLGVDHVSLEYDLRRGLTMQQIVDERQPTPTSSTKSQTPLWCSDVFNPRPPLIRASSAVLIKTPEFGAQPPLYQFVGSCNDCMLDAREAYAKLHARHQQHKEQQQARAEGALMEKYLNLPDSEN